jgi:hypothetical protein
MQTFGSMASYSYLYPGISICPRKQTERVIKGYYNQHVMPITCRHGWRRSGEGDTHKTGLGKMAWACGGLTFA